VRVLALDTATSATAVALCDVPEGELVVALRDDPPPGARPRHARCSLSLIVQVLERARADWSGIDRIAVGIGPGTFTGLRIGIATARGLAQAQGLSLVGVSTLESLALGAAPAADRTVVAVIDARRREVFTAAWDCAPPDRLGARRLEPVAIAPQALAERLGDRLPGAVAVGDGAVKFREILERSGAVVPEDGSELHLVSAIDHCRLAAGMETGAPEDVRPDYLRLPDAELGRRAPNRR
jgi:tRNA threonylcarbamoyladenosine biosynthesis protein TsaB